MSADTDVQVQAPASKRKQRSNRQIWLAMPASLREDWEKEAAARNLSRNAVLVAELTKRMEQIKQNRRRSGNGRGMEERDEWRRRGDRPRDGKGAG